jgi:hypothetical protein
MPLQDSVDVWSFWRLDHRGVRKSDTHRGEGSGSRWCRGRRGGIVIIIRFGDLSCLFRRGSFGP